MRVRLVVLGLAAFGYAGCNREKPKPAESPPPGVEVSRPVRMTVTDYREYTGYIEATKVIAIRARIRGILKAVKFQEGTDVDEGAAGVPDDHEDPRHLASSPVNDSHRANTTLP